MVILVVSLHHVELTVNIIRHAFACNVALVIEHVNTAAVAKMPLSRPMVQKPLGIGTHRPQDQVMSKDARVQISAASFQEIVAPGSCRDRTCLFC